MNDRRSAVFRKIAAGLLTLFALLSATACASDSASRSTNPKPPIFVEPEGGNGGLPASSTLPARYRREGMISSNTYQVLVTVVAQSAADARVLGEDAGKQRATELMQNERSISSRIGYYGREEIRRLVQSEGQVVHVHKEQTEGNYTVVLQVFKAGLHRYLQKLN